MVEVVNTSDRPYHISIDLETFDKTPTSALATIGAYTRDGSFYRVVDDRRGSWSPETIRWHAKQDGTYDNIGHLSDAIPLSTALEDFTEWLNRHNANKQDKAYLWTHATFDMPILHSAYNRAGKNRPWHYRNCRDLRTLYHFAGGRPDIENNDQEHHALSDAEYQYREIKACLEQIKGE